MLLREGGSRAAASWGRSTPVHGAARARKGWGSTTRFGAHLPARRRSGTGTAPRTEGHGAALVPWAELFPTGREGSWSPPLPPSLCPPSPFVRFPLFYVPLRIPVPHQGWCCPQPARMWGGGGFSPPAPPWWWHTDLVFGEVGRAGGTSRARPPPAPRVWLGVFLVLQGLGKWLAPWHCWGGCPQALLSPGFVWGETAPRCAKHTHSPGHCCDPGIFSLVPPVLWPGGISSSLPCTGGFFSPPPGADHQPQHLVGGGTGLGSAEGAGLQPRCPRALRGGRGHGADRGWGRGGGCGCWALSRRQHCPSRSC